MLERDFAIAVSPSSVTELDIVVEELLEIRLSELDPHIGFYGEETTNTELVDTT